MQQPLCNQLSSQLTQETGAREGCLSRLQSVWSFFHNVHSLQHSYEQAQGRDESLSLPGTALHNHNEKSVLWNFSDGLVAVSFHPLKKCID